MAFRTSEEYRRAWAELRRHGMLLLQDPALPSVASLVAGEPVRGSWWGHPRARDIYQVSGQLGDHPEVLQTKLLSGKVTYLHRTLWPAFLAVARCREPWQMQRLPPAARRLLRRVEHQGTLEPEPRPPRAEREAVTELERRLLIHTEEVHTSRGSHTRRLRSWESWIEEAGSPGPEMTPNQGRARLLEAVRKLCRAGGGSCKLPWEG